MNKLLKKSFILSVALLSISNVTLSQSNIDAAAVNWGYTGDTGPENWALLDNNFAICATGATQSPIDIPATLTPIDKDLNIKYQKTPLVIINDGDTRLNVGGQSIIFNDGHSLQINFPEASSQVNMMPETISFKGDSYNLIQLHFHVPSEHKVNGKQYPMEIHFVHQGDNGKVAVIGVFAEVGDNTNQELQDIINNIPTNKGQVNVLQDAFVDPSMFIPADTAYYNYVGSLTTPPCTEGLNWIVLKQPIKISYQQLEDFRYLLDAGNARPVQALNNREVMTTKN